MKKQFKGRRSLIASFVASTLASAAAGPGMVWAPSTAATLAGYTTPGATVTVHNPATGLTRHGVAAGDGHFVIAGLPAGDYTVDAGPGTEQPVTRAVATTTQLDLSTKLAEVTVTGSAIHQETMTSEVAQVVSLHDIDALPQYTRNFLEFASRVPGVQFNIDGSRNSQTPGGAQLYSNRNVYIDGVSQKHYANGGNSGQPGPGQSGDPGNPLPQPAIEEHTGATATVTPLLPPDVASQFGATTNPFTEDLGFGKVAFEPTDTDRMELSAKVRLEHSLQGAANQTAASAAAHYKSDDVRWNLRWVHD